MPCIKPIFLKQQEQHVPCGKCPGCKLKRVNDWVFRLENEAKRHGRASFITLTYDNNNIPISQKGFMTLRKHDFQCFIKRLRYETGDNRGAKRIMYYAAGEYGGITFRPHYHAIIFDVYQEQVEASWGLGYVDYRMANSNTMAYVCKYICKDKKIPLHRNDDREPEKAFMSKNIGLNYIDDATLRFHNDNMASYTIRNGGYKAALPRYYRDRIFDSDAKILLNAEAQVRHDEIRDIQTKQAETFGITLDMHKRMQLSVAYQQQVEKQKQRNKI